MTILQAAGMVAAAAEAERELPIPPLAFGAITLGGFLTLLAVLWAFRGAGDRH